MRSFEAVLEEELSGLAALAHFSTDRIAETQLLADTLVARIDGSLGAKAVSRRLLPYVTATIREDPQALSTSNMDRGVNVSLNIWRTGLAVCSVQAFAHNRSSSNWVHRLAKTFRTPVSPRSRSSDSMDRHP